MLLLSPILWIVKEVFSSLIKIGIFGALVVGAIYYLSR